ncbi:hypothetical protein DOTSEDRAFT_27344 [Dothistroma septosporum NZE10]|uniref:Uncharacterized protein n=1 Tax=Dothistroma septosporum (strain NZE10 / CBS 128990) TaxID=675120 RepID=N1PF64_DOTSN|nr:hypothetical protein DOTSEDRAFT_27344 [Dothistroma septosporum NZE10]
MGDSRFNKSTADYASSAHVGEAFNDPSIYPVTTVVRNGEKRQCHKLTLCAQSKDARVHVCSSEFAEAKQDYIKLEGEDDEQVVKAMLQF